MATKIQLQISKLNEHELLQRLDTFVKQLEQCFGHEQVDDLLFRLGQMSVVRIYQGACNPSLSTEKDHFCLDLEQLTQLEQLFALMNSIFASIEAQLGNLVAERLMYQLMYRLSIRHGKYDHLVEDSDSVEEYGERTREMLQENAFDAMIFVYSRIKPHEWLLLTNPSNISKSEQQKEVKVKEEDEISNMKMCTSEDVNRANEERELHEEEPSKHHIDSFF